VGVLTDARGAMVPEALEDAVKDAKARGKTPFLVCATAGTTVTGAFDPLGDLADVAQAHGMWLHVDGAWGGAAMLSQKHREPDMSGVERADSLAFNPHKLMNVPLPCSAFLTKEPGSLAACNSANAAYLFQPDKNYADLDLGDRTISCGRKADAFKLWLAWKALGDEGLEAHVDKAYALAAHLEDRVRNSGGKFVMVMPRSCTNVCFWYVPERLRPLAGDVAKAPEALREELHRVAPALKDRMQRAGLGLIGFQPNKGLPNHFRCVIAGGIGIEASDLDELLDEMDKLGRDL